MRAVLRTWERVFATGLHCFAMQFAPAPLWVENPHCHRRTVQTIPRLQRIGSLPKRTFAMAVRSWGHCWQL